MARSPGPLREAQEVPLVAQGLRAVEREGGPEALTGLQRWLGQAEAETRAKSSSIGHKG